MLELYFITSNRTKLAHFVHIAKRFGVRIIGFRERTYYGSYDEPDSVVREEVLSKSYASALSKWKRSGLPASAMFFFEDTSVRIESKSDGGSDFPGTRIKFWMRENSFEDLDASLGGRERAASIRSDIVLHLPEHIRRYLGIKDVYREFNGAVSGVIAKHPSLKRRPNLLYPWLDPNTFSGWFLPNGESDVLSDLDIEHADLNDFRLKSFESMLCFLRGLHLDLSLESKAPTQSSLGFISPRKVVVFLGRTCAGKTTAARELSKNGRAIHLEASDFMRAELVRRHGRRSSVRVRDFAAAALREEPWIVPNQLIEIISKFPSVNFVVSGLRSPVEVDLLTRGLLGDQVSCIWIEAGQRVRFDRSVERNRSGRAESYPEFRQEDNAQSLMGLSALRRRKGSIRIVNEGSIEGFLSRIEDVVHIEASGDAGGVSLALDGLLGLLERRLILALGRLGGESTYFTSGQLASYTRDPANSMVRTNKDNISRFFNQITYPFFEIKARGAGTEIRLSNSGVSLFHQLEFIGTD